jgi:hypothetical protein
MSGTVQPYQYVVLRCVPRVDREEFVNVGVALFCQASGYLRMDYRVDGDRLQAVDASVVPAEVISALDDLRDVCGGQGPAADLSLGERFGLLAAPRSTVIQSSPVHGGVTEDPDATLRELVLRLVSR